MEANKFMTEYQRMCASHANCRDCLLRTDNGQCTEIPSNYHEEFVAKLTKTVEEWSAAHPCKTRQSVFLEQWPEARVDKDGILSICPADIAKSLRDEYGGRENPMENCRKCRREFWGQEVE